MIEFLQLLKNIPDGKKVEYLGENFLKGIGEYYQNFIGHEVDIDEIMVDNIDLILTRRNSFIKDLTLFSGDDLSTICQKYGLDDIKNANEAKIKDVLIAYYGLHIPEEDVNIYHLSVVSQCNQKLHGFQDRIRRKVINQLFSGKKKFLIHMPTGAGKTRTASEIIIDFIRLSSFQTLLNKKMKVVWVAQQEELCIQAYETIKFLIEAKGTQNLMFGHYYGGRELPANIENEPAIIFCGIQQLMNNYKNDIWNKIRNDNYLIVVDEAHRSIASEWVKALDSFTKNDSVILLGLTATPGSGSANNLEKNYSLSKYYGSNKINILDENYKDVDKPIEFLTEKGFLARIVRVDIESNSTSNITAKTIASGIIKFERKALKLLSVNANRNSSIINIIKTHVERKEKILVFTCGTEHNLILSQLLKVYKINNKVIEANTKGRSSIIEEFREGDLPVLLNFGVLTTGFDAPKTNVCIIARPIESIVMYSQMVGRILRGPENGKGNKTNTLYTIKDNLNHGDYDDLFKSFDEFWN